MSRKEIYIIEFLGIAGFVLIGSLVSMLLENAASPINKTVLVHYPVIRRCITGAALGVYLVLATNAASKSSGAHANPVMTWAYLRLGKISQVNAYGYVLFQCAGAIAAVLLLKFTFKEIFSTYPINNSLAAPQATYSLLTAFIAEFVITLIFVTTVLFFNSAARLENYSAVATGILICLFYTFEQPYSSMSINPARSLAGAVGAGQWKELWVYFTAPIAGMLIATEHFIFWQRRTHAERQYASDKKAGHLFWHTKEIPYLPEGRQS